MEELVLDGNAIGGLLGEVFAVDVTAAAPAARAAGREPRSGRCACTSTQWGPSCAAPAAAMSSCGPSVRSDRVWLDLSGVSYLELRL